MATDDLTFGLASESASLTSVHVRKATAGDRGSIEWLVTHLSPLLFAEARYRLSPALRGLYEAADLVQDAWLVTIPRLKDLVPRRGRMAPVLLKFLSETLLRRHRHLVEKHLAGKPLQQRLGADVDTDQELELIDPATTGVVTKAINHEALRAVARCLEKLSPDDSEIIVLRSIEELPYAMIEARLGVSKGALYTRHCRALQRLRECLPPTLVDELEADIEPI